MSATTLTLRRKSRAVFKWLRFGMLCTAVAFLYASEANGQCAAKDVLQNVAAPRIAAAIAPSIDAVRETWKTITLGRFTNSFALRNALDAAGCGVGDVAEQILARPAFTLNATKMDIDLVVVSAVELGIETKTTSLAQLYTRAQSRGLILAPVEVGPQLRLQYLDQPLDEFLLIGMKPLSTWMGEPVIFVLANGGSGLTLIGQNGGTNTNIQSTSRFLFVRPNALAKKP